jgi:glutamate/tyrosine decarboxylase-like PLP-dependent enzyme
MKARSTPGAEAPETFPEPDLDPADWEAFRAAGRLALDRMIDHLETRRAGKVWRQAPPAVREHFAAPLPQAPRDMADVLGDVFADIEPFVTGNTHPLFMGWVHGAGTPAGMVAEMIAAGLDANCGGRNHIGLDVERQITRWMAKAFGFPDDASGLFVTGTSSANLIGLLVARTKAQGEEVRKKGLLGDGRQLVAYASTQAHGCIVQAMEIAGIGSQHLRLVPVAADYAMRVDLLPAMIAADRRAGALPFLVIGSAGTVNTGAIDDLAQIADVAAREKLWFHVDGAFGALAALSAHLAPLVKGIERAHSIAFDFHKWAHVPYDAGFLLVRDPQMHKRTFANPAAYLQRASRGLAAGETWPCDLGPDLSRGFRALKTWFTFEVHGAGKIAACIEHTCRLAAYLEGKLAKSRHFAPSAPVKLNIVCFSVKDSPDGEINREIVMDLHEQGEAAPSLTILDGRPVIRAAIVNHRTKKADIDRFVAALETSRARVSGRSRKKAVS